MSNITRREFIAVAFAATLAVIEAGEDEDDGEPPTQSE